VVPGIGYADEDVGVDEHLAGCAAYQVQLQYDTAKASNSGTTVPVKLLLQNAAGTTCPAPGIKVTVTGLSPSPARGKAPADTFARRISRCGSRSVAPSTRSTWPTNAAAFHRKVAPHFERARTVARTAPTAGA